MKYMCIIGGFSYGGAERVITNIANYLGEVETTIMVGLTKYDPPAYAINNKVKIVNGLQGNKLKKIKALRKLIKKEKPDVILSFMTQINIATIISSICLHIPVVVSERCDPSKTEGIARRILRAATYPLACGFVFQTEEAKSFFSNSIQRRSTVIGNPVFIEDENIIYNCQERKKEIVGVGRLDAQKNFMLLIQAFSDIHIRFPEYSLRIYGEGPQRDLLQEEIDRMGLGDFVCLCGQSNTIHKDIRDSSIFVLSSDFEGMPNALLEAMTLGLACISSDCPVGGSRELINDGVNGLLFEVGNRSELVYKLTQLIENDATRELMGKNARKIYQEYNADTICKKWKSFLDYIANR